MGVCFRARVMRCSSDGMFRTGCGAVQTCRRGCQYVACDGCLRGPGRVVVRCGRGLFPGRRGADVRCGGSGHARVGCTLREVSEVGPAPARLRARRRRWCPGEQAVRVVRVVKAAGRRAIVVRIYKIGMGSERKEAGARKRGRVKTVTCETDVPRRVCARKRECAGWTGAKRLAACQYMFSYMDCDLSYFRSESDAALTPMLKLHER